MIKGRFAIRFITVPGGCRCTAAPSGPSTRAPCAFRTLFRKYRRRPCTLSEKSKRMTYEAVVYDNGVKSNVFLSSVITCSESFQEEPRTRTRKRDLLHIAMPVLCTSVLIKCGRVALCLWHCISRGETKAYVAFVEPNVTPPQDSRDQGNRGWQATALC